LLDSHWLVRLETNQTCVTSLEEGRVCFLASLVGLFEEFLETNSHLSGVCVEHRSVSDGNSLWNVHELNLSDEGFVVSNEHWLVVSVSCNVATANVLLSEATAVETDVVSRLGLLDHGVVHFD